MDFKALKETLLTFLRGVYFTVLGILVSFLVSLSADQSLLATKLSIGDWSLPVGVVIVGAIAGVAKLIDRYIHKNENIKYNGIAPEFLQ